MRKNTENTPLPKEGDKKATPHDRGRSKVKLETLEKKVGTLLDSMEKHVERTKALDNRLNHLMVKFSKMVKYFNETTKLCSDTATLTDNHDDRLKMVEDLLKSVMLRVEEHNDTIALLKRAPSHGSSVVAPMRIKVKEPEPFDGTRNTKLLGIFCWDVEQHLD